MKITDFTLFDKVLTKEELTQVYRTGNEDYPEPLQKHVVIRLFPNGRIERTKPVE